MKKTTIKNLVTSTFFLLFTFLSYSQVVLENEIKISDIALHFNGEKVASNAPNTGDDKPYDYFFGRNISAHGDCIKTYKEYVFMTWYRGGKEDRHVMLTRYNTKTGTSVDIEFPHRHTGYQNRYWIGESHNAIAVGVSPLDGTIHLLYDMHAYSRTRPSNGSLSKDYFRYSYSTKDAASLSDEEFTLDKFVKNSEGGYKHLSLNGGEDYANFNALTYPQFFLNDAGDLFMYMREGGNNNGAYKFSKYNASSSTWSSFTDFNILGARNRGQQYNWGLYGDIRYENGKIRIGFQRRSQNNDDKYQYQNGIYYAYSDDQDGLSDWKNFKGESFGLPLIDSDKIFVTEPGDLVETTAKNQVYIVGGFDWTVTDQGDVHFISRVEDRENGVTKHVHTYQKAGEPEFTTTTEFAGAEAIYTSGNDIYIIGLKNDRVFIEKAKGGTNNFRRVYEATSGKSFDHGRVHIANGKLHYYLMEKKSGNALPVYLQIIDLDINADPKPLNITFTDIEENQEFGAEKNIEISVDAFTDNGLVDRVEFIIDGDLFITDNVAPFKTNWIPKSAGSHVIEAVAYSSSGEVERREVSITVNERDFTDLSGDVYTIRNVATSKYLKSQGSSIVASNLGGTEDTYWEFLRSPTNGFFNIDSKVRGTIRVTGAGQLISSSKNVANSDTDKTWTVVYHESDKTYSFKARTGNRYLSGNASGMSVTSVINNSSKWVVESINTLSTDDNLSINNSIKVFPNPTENKFTIKTSGINKSKIVIFDALGKIVYNQSVNSSSTEINTDKSFTSGVYVIRINTGNTVSFKKLIIN